MDKLDKYATSFLADKEKDVIRSEKSCYYNFGGYILRISDHIGTNSSGRMSIIKTLNPNQFVIHTHNSGNIRVLNYNDTKNIVKCFATIGPALLGPHTHPFELEKAEINGAVTKSVKKIRGENREDLILGIPKTRFSTGQINQIMLYIKQNIK